MMTSVPTYPMTATNYSTPTSISTSGKIGAEESAASTSFPTSLRLVKRSLSFSAESCKKRRKQSTPIRISTTGTPPTNSDVSSDDNANGHDGHGVVLGIGLCCEGKLDDSFLPSSHHHHDHSSLLDTSSISMTTTATTTTSTATATATETTTTTTTTTMSLTPSLSIAASSNETDQLLSHVKIETLTEDTTLDNNKTIDIPTDIASPMNLSGAPKFSPWLTDVSVNRDDLLASSTTATGISSAIASAATTYSSTSTTMSISNTCQQVRSSCPPTTRIFNPEAYCELCNKEFCNKYFLKTHKANKHRIYTDSSILEMTSISVGVSIPANVPTYTTSGYRKTAVTLMSNCDVTSPKNIDVMNKPPVPVPVPVSVPVSTAAIDTNPFFQNIVCNICGKGFSNNLFFKAHLASAHKISSDPELDNECSEERTITTITIPKEEQELKVLPNTADDDKENILLRNDPTKEDSLPLPSVSEPDQDQESLMSVARDTLDYSANRLRRVGIMNPEAFCDICCKEYCNKYFLRTHKMKRHGIIMPDDNSKDNQKDFKLELSISNNWYQIQTSPLNLIMGEQNTNSSGSYSDRKSSPLNENECEICGMRFQTQYLAQLHLTAAHLNYKSSNDSDRDNKNQNESGTVSPNGNLKQTSDSISEDLQKLQTMISQLNDLEVSRVGMNVSGIKVNCNLCSKQFENKYFLHVHMITEHCVLQEDTTADISKQSEIENTLDLNICKQCGREGFTLDELQNHLTQCHPMSFAGVSSTTNVIQTNSVANTTSAATILTTNAKDDLNGFVNSDKIANRIGGGIASLVGAERRSSVTLTPTSSYCEICNKELCNKYFMKTHMQRMHGIEIENGAQIGGVVCNICNKELCSKYFLRVHKHNTHGIIEDGTSANAAPNQRQISTDSDQHSSNTDQSNMFSSGVITGNTADPALKPNDLSDLNHRYFSHFTEVCPICNRRFRSTKWLKAHLLSDHGKLGIDKWNEIEIQLEQSLGQQLHLRKPSGDCPSPMLRIPNSNQSLNKTDSNLQNVLSSLLGASDETNVKQYQCSFCSFSTPVLAFLFVHERSHTNNQSVETLTDAEGSEPKAISTAAFSTTASASASASASIHCPICNQSFGQPDELQHHIMSQHSFLNLSSFFNFIQPQQQQQPIDIQTQDEPKQQITAGTDAMNEKISLVLPLIPSRCTQCGQSKQQEGVGLSADVSLTLKTVSKQRQLPTTYALPQRSQQQSNYMMQAFLMDEANASADIVDNSNNNSNTTTVHSSNSSTSITASSATALTTSSSGVTVAGLGPITSSSSTTTHLLDTDQQQQQEQQQQQQQRQCDNAGNNHSNSRTLISDRRFAPSIVFLPVFEKLTAPLTVSFTLTPA